ncbi:retrovirus-related Pol polyprotein from transposon 412 [Trichonephila clavipes]|nr:retrovirus-related Pol polyprotein from transposon 412 [Trichonephila clavipes]
MELLAIVKAVEHFHPYFYGRRSLLQTDHALLNFKNPESQIARWIQSLQEYDVEIRHRKGSAHGNADALLRRPCSESCEYCSGVEKKFGIIDPTRVLTILNELHGGRTGGYFGVVKTLQKVCEHFYWNNVWSDEAKWCHICDPCAARKGPRKRIRGRQQLYNGGAPFERIAFAILGSLPRSSDGNNNILVVMDYFTKWPEAYPISDQEASTVAEVLV